MDPQIWPGKLIMKGILDVEDARLAAKTGAQAIVVSNHGGRQLDGAPSSISVLPKIADAVGSEIEILFDGGIRSGQDVMRALALGAKACLIGRAYIFGLGAGGQAGVARRSRSSARNSTSPWPCPASTASTRSTIICWRCEAQLSPSSRPSERKSKTTDVRDARSCSHSFVRQRTSVVMVPWRPRMPVVDGTLLQATLIQIKARPRRTGSSNATPGTAGRSAVTGSEACSEVCHWLKHPNYPSRKRCKKSVARTR